MARYEITGPDGAKYEVTAPDNATEEQVLSYAQSQFGKPQEPKKPFLGLPQPSPEGEAAIDRMKAKPFGSGIPKLAYEVGGAVTDAVAGSSGQGSPMDLFLPMPLRSNPANPLGVNIPPEVSGGAGVFANFLTNALPSMAASSQPTQPSMPSWFTWPARKLMQSAVKPSVNAGKDGKAAIQTMLDERIYPTMSGMEKVSKITSKIDDQVDKLVSGSDAQVGVASVGSRLKDVHKRAMTQVNPQDDLAAVKNTWDEFRTSPLIKGKTEIPAKLAHELKKGTYRSLGGKSYGEVGSASTEAQKALARGMREEVAEAVPAVKPLLERQGALLNVKDVATPRALIEANKNPGGLGTLALGHSPGAALAFWADRWAALKAFAALQGYTGTKPELLLPLLLAGQNKTSTAPLLRELGLVE